MGEDADTSRGLGAGTAPASRDVLAELKVVRQRSGLSTRKLRDRCWALLSLRATDQELRRRQLADDDKHVAAYEMIKCAVPALVLRTDYARILEQTLNLHGDAKRDLDRRRDGLRTELCLHDKAYDRHEERAYEEFAGLLVAAEQSPCATPMPPKKIDVDIRLALDVEQLAYVLGLLSLEQRQFIRAALACKVFDVLPNGRRATMSVIDLREDEKTLAALQLLVERLVRRLWLPFAPGRLDSQVFQEQAIIDLLFHDDDLQLARRRIAAQQAETYPGWEYVVNMELTEQYFSVQESSLQILSRLIVSIEQDDDWKATLESPPPSIPIERDRLG